MKLSEAQRGRARAVHSAQIAMPRSGGRGDLLASTITVLLSTVFLTLVSPQLRHWFVVPVMVAGALAAKDLVPLTRRSSTASELRLLVSGTATYLVYAAPLLHVALDSWMGWVDHPPDWRPWLGYIAIVNAVGLACYHLINTFRSPIGAPRRTWRISPAKLPRSFTVSLIMGAIGIIWLYARVGGPSGYLDAFVADRDRFEGIGALLVFAESFPMLLFLVVVIRFRSILRSNTLARIAVLLALSLLQILIAAPRGSRAGIIFVVLWAVGALHLWIRPVSRNALLAAFPVILLFTYTMGFYKAEGLTGVLTAITDSAERSRIEEQHGRSPQDVLLGDFARADVQARVLYGVQSFAPHDYGWGSSYLHALLLPLPISAEESFGLRGKVSLGTDSLYYVGSAREGLQSTRVYGLVGEGILNFGPVGGVMALTLLGLAVSRLANLPARLSPHDPRLLLLPAVWILVPLALWTDADVIVFFLVKNLTLPVIAIAMASEVRARRPLAH